MVKRLHGAWLKSHVRPVFLGTQTYVLRLDEPNSALGKLSGEGALSYQLIPNVGIVFVEFLQLLCATQLGNRSDHGQMTGNASLFIGLQLLDTFIRSLKTFCNNGRSLISNPTGKFSKFRLFALKCIEDCASPFMPCYVRRIFERAMLPGNCSRSNFFVALQHGFENLGQLCMLRIRCATCHPTPSLVYLV